MVWSTNYDVIINLHWLEALRLPCRVPVLVLYFALACNLAKLLDCLDCLVATRLPLLALAIGIKCYALSLSYGVEALELVVGEIGGDNLCYLLAWASNL